METREGNLIIVAEHPPAGDLYGSMRNEIEASNDDIDTPTLPTSDWNPSL